MFAPPAALVVRTTGVKTRRRCRAGARMPGERTSAHLRGIGYGSRGCSSGSRYPCPSHTTRSWAACTCATHSGDPSLFTSPPSAGLCCRSSQPGNRCRRRPLQGVQRNVRRAVREVPCRLHRQRHRPTRGRAGLDVEADRTRRERGHHVRIRVVESDVAVPIARLARALTSPTLRNTRRFSSRLLSS